MPDEHWKRIGYITVDSGLCWIGDPSYVLHEEPDPAVGKTWLDFCEKVKNKAHKTFGNGLGVVTSTGFGDGIYPVEALIEDGRIMAVRVMFDDSSEKVPNMKEQWDKERG